jgi:hypothetical protein
MKMKALNSALTIRNQIKNDLFPTTNKTNNFCYFKFAKLINKI